MLLLSYLVPRLYERGYRMRIDRRGNRITSIAVPACGIAFRDICKLLAASTNLRKFGQLFNLPQEKAHFPFAALKSVADLKRPRLPVDRESWQSDLGFKSTQLDERQLQATIEEAERLFHQANCQSLGDYLETYLRLDVDILLKASQEWRRQLFRLTGLDFVDCSKYTMSSLSYTAGLKKMEADLRIGQFFPNNSQHYRLLRQGMRG